MPLTEEIVLVTGASRGIGQAIALQLGRQGATVIGTATTEKGAAAIQTTFEEQSVKGLGLALDVTQDDSIDAAIMVTQAVVINAIIAMLFVWLAHAFLPDPPPPASSTPRPAPPKPSRELAIWSAWRSTMIVFPVMMFFLFYSGSASYLVVMIKVASMGQQVENDNTRAAGRSLLLSTIYGGIGAIFLWQVLSVWPSLTIYTLIIALGGLIMGRRVFQGLAMHPQAGTWSYAFLTMIVVIAPAVMDSAGGDAAGAKFWERLIMLVAATLYSVLAVTVYDAFRPKEKCIAGEQSTA